jgi:hypothetical protein
MLPPLFKRLSRGVYTPIPLLTTIFNTKTTSKYHLTKVFPKYLTNPLFDRMLPSLYLGDLNSSLSITKINNTIYMSNLTTHLKVGINLAHNYRLCDQSVSMPLPIRTLHLSTKLIHVTYEYFRCCINDSLVINALIHTTETFNFF